MSDTKEMNDKINHIDKAVIRIETLLANQSEKFAESVRVNSIILNEHDQRLKLMEKNAHTFQGAVTTLNRLLTIFGSVIIAGAVWTFSQINELKHNQKITENELNFIKQKLVEHNERFNK